LDINKDKHNIFSVYKGGIVVKYRLKQLLAEKEFNENRIVSLNELSTELGVARSTLSRIANNRGYGTQVEIIEKLCRYFNCSPNDLMTIVPDPAVGNEAEGRENAR